MNQPFQFDFLAMGSPCGLSLYAEDHNAAGTIAEAAIAEVQRIEKKYSRYLPDSLVSEINRAAASGSSICVDAETALLIDHAFEAHILSGGLFDITSGRMKQIWNDDIRSIPGPADIAGLLTCVGLDKVAWQRPRLTFTIAGMEVDLGGIAKEYAADRAAAVCVSAGARHGLVNLAGDLAIFGPHPDGAAWRIGIRDPFSEDAVATLFVSGGGLATSGDYERYWKIDGRRFSHLIDPTTGWPVESLPSITVAADSCLAAGLASTIAALKGRAGPQWLRERGAAHLYVETSGALGGSIPLDDHPAIP